MTKKDTRYYFNHIKDKKRKEGHKIKINNVMDYKRKYDNSKKTWRETKQSKFIMKNCGSINIVEGG